MYAAAVGKLPAHGDFVFRGVGPATFSAWDAWAEATLEAERNRLAESFDAEFERAPPWQFVLSPGPYAEGWSAGALAPSIDAVGRKFFIIAMLAGLDAGEALSLGVALAGTAEAAIYQAIAETLTVDAMVGRIQAEGRAMSGLSIPALSGLASTAAVGAWWTAHGGALSSPRPPCTVLGSGPSEVCRP